MILKFLVTGGLIYLTYILFRNKKSIAKPSEQEEAVELIKDPVCDTFVEKDTEFKVKYYDKLYYFCSDECQQKFISSKKDK